MFKNLFHETVKDLSEEVVEEQEVFSQEGNPPLGLVHRTGTVLVAHLAYSEKCAVEKDS